MSIICSLVVVFSDCGNGNISSVPQNGVSMYSGNVSRVISFFH